MLARLTCDPKLTFSDLCSFIDSHDGTGIFGPAVQRILGPLIVFVVVLVIARLLRGFLERAINRAGGDPQVRTLVHNVVTAGMWIFAILAALVEAGLNLSILLTFGGLSTLAVGLAFQDLLRNVLAGMWLLMEQPFRIGDSITIGDQAGVVQTIKLRTTALRTFDGRLAILPNLTAFNGVVLNSSAYNERQFSVSVHVPAGSDLGTLMKSLRAELKKTKEIAEHPAPVLTPHLAADGTHSVLVKYWLDYREHDPDAVMAELTSRLWAAGPVQA